MTSITPSSPFQAAMRLRVTQTIATGCLLIVSCRTSVVADEAVSFVQDVRPILAENCLACHGADEGSRQADLRLDIPAAASNSESAAARAIVPGKPDESELMLRILVSNPDLRMPPPDSGHSLTPEQIQTLRSWIAAGAEYETHWAFAGPQRPEIPVDRADSWSRSPIDRLVWKTLRQKELSPQSDADPLTLIRRLSLDLTGLPPTPAQADAFAADPSEEHYQAVITQLLDSPAFGEHWARMWLDLARYADTKGYEKDQPREIWRYRDWVIDALNADLPFDRFTIEQLAGDLLPDATPEQILATAFHRNTMTNDEGGTDDEEFRIAAVKDRVDTTVQVWMGLTMGCAKCHSHKYDPISQTEYYQLMAFFNQTEDADRSDDAPRVPTPTLAQRRQQQDLEHRMAELQQQYQTITPAFTAAQRVWEQQLQDQQPDWQAAIPVRVAAEHGTSLQIQPDRSVLAGGTLPPRDLYQLDLQPEVNSAEHASEEGRTNALTAIRLEALTHDSLPRKGPGRFRNDPNFVLNELTLRIIDVNGVAGPPVPLKDARADFSQGGWEVEKAIDGDPETGWAISPQQSQSHVAVFVLRFPVAFQPGQLLRLELLQHYAANPLLLGRVRISTSTRQAETLPTEPQATLEVVHVPVDQRTPEQQRLLQDAWRRIDPTTAPIGEEIGQLQSQLDALQKSIPRTPVMKELPSDRHRATRIHVRGNFLEQGDEVMPALPAAFASNAELDEGYRGNRLQVAHWLMSPENPLTSRVMVNRVWARLFGRGLVETEEDFGLQGALPDHPELLDWLAVDFRETGHWSLKDLCRTIVSSSTYRQSSRQTEETREADPENRWLSRGARFRLTAETVRDQALAVSGLLSAKVGGPSVMPPQPDGIWRTTYSTLKWETPENEDRYRRGIYTYLRRTSPYPSMITFDAGSGEVCLIRRIPTNTPLQALVTMNDPVFIEAAGALALTTGKNSGDKHAGTHASGTQPGIDPGNKEILASLNDMFRRVLIRPAADSELRRLQTMWQHALDEFRASPEAADALLRSANLSSQPAAAEDPTGLAALTVAASVLLNLDETLARP